MGLLKVREGNYKGSMVGAGGVCWQREHAFPFQVLLKPSLIRGEGRPRRFPPNNEHVGRGMGGSQLGASPGDLQEPQTFAASRLPHTCLAYKWHSINARTINRALMLSIFHAILNKMSHLVFRVFLRNFYFY
jgi:hypothetical protein